MSLLSAVLVLSSSRAALAGDVDETVYLQNGGRVRGIVLEQDPTTGVRLRLPDGTTRTFAANEVHHVAYGKDSTEVRSDVARTVVRFGVGGEPVLWYVPASKTTHLGVRAFGRMQMDVSSLAVFRVDLAVAALDGVSSDYAIDRGATSIPISVRADLQFNPTKHYAIDLGVDLGVDIYRESSLQAAVLNTGGDNDIENVGGRTVFGATGMFGVHVSPVTLRFGPSNQFQVAAQEGVLFFFEDGRNPAFEQTIGFTYLFGSPAGM